MSQLKQPSKIPSFASGRELSEMSASQNNVRTASASAMPPPQVAGLKHKAPQMTEPSAKRKTLADRAAEPYHPRPAAPPMNGYPNGAVAATVQAGLRNTSFSSSTSSRLPSAQSRNTSTSSYSSSIGSTRPWTKYGQGRPGTAMGHSRANSYHAGATVRPATSQAHYHEEKASGPEAAPFGRVPPLIATPKSLCKLPKRHQRHLKTHNVQDTARSSSFVGKKHSQRGASPPSSVPRQIALFHETTIRDTSISTALKRMQLDERDVRPRLKECKSDDRCPATPSLIPRLAQTPTPSQYANQQHALDVPFFCRPPSPSKSPEKSCSRPVSPTKPQFLNKFTNVTAPRELEANIMPWSDPDFANKITNIESMMEHFKASMQGTNFERNQYKEIIDLMKAKIQELEGMKMQLEQSNEVLRLELEECRVNLNTSSATLDDTKRSHSWEMDEIQRKHRNDVADAQQSHNSEVDRLRRQTQELEDQLRRNGQEELDRLIRNHKEDIADLERRLNSQLEDEKRARAREVHDLTQQRDMQLQSTAIDIGKRDREAEALRDELKRAKDDTERERTQANNLRDQLNTSAANATTLESLMVAMKAKIDFLEGNNQQQSQAFADLHKRMQEAIEAEQVAKEKLIVEETLRRKLHNQVQELKGNIRVFCRVRPSLEGEADEAAKIAFPDADSDSKEINVQGPEQVSSLGKVTSTQNAFSFDRVFAPAAQNGDVFDEISQLVQSALDGYNVCIFCYGQTGSGKTFTMQSADGMIPRAVAQIYECAESLREKGWTYSMEGNFVEVYNENLNDLLGKAEDLDKKKLEIRHDTQKLKTTITDITTVKLDTPEKMEGLLQRASKNRSVAATKANERSSRSHCVFILNLVGENSITGERSEGTLNLVDLAGSERLSHSQAEGARLKETQNINKSLSCLGDVIAALGDCKGNGHIPYRNSKLTYLLQYSLGGNSKTLMFVMVSPLQAHLTDTLTSLKFAKKVHSTHIGTAKKQTKVKD